MQTESANAWMDFGYGVSHVAMRQINEFSMAGFKYRLAPRTILVNGVEVPAPEKDMPKHGVEYFLPSEVDDMMFRSRWNNNETLTRKHIQMGIVYLDKESAIARAKAMLITQEVK